jgi:hypothetical protein
MSDDGIVDVSLSGVGRRVGMGSGKTAGFSDSGDRQPDEQTKNTSIRISDPYHFCISYTIAQGI